MLAFVFILSAVLNKLMRVVVIMLSEVGFCESRTGSS